MKTAIAHLKSVSPYSQSRAHETPKKKDDTNDQHEERTWREKCHVTDEGNIFIPPMSFKMALDTGAQMLGKKIPGKRNATYTKFFKSGVLVQDPAVLPHKKDDIPGDRIYVNSDGVRGSGKRVWKTFPRIDQWEADVKFFVIAPEIGKDVFEEHLHQAGSFVGIGRFRPQNGGYYGRFIVESVTWE